jgi:hypothetical protein
MTLLLRTGDSPYDATRPAYIGLALRATGRPRWQHYATKAEAHSLRARRTRGEGYVRSHIFNDFGGTLQPSTPWWNYPPG